MTIWAFSVGESLTWPFLARSERTVSTMPTAPVAMRWRAAMMAAACWRYSMAPAISGL